VEAFVTEIGVDYEQRVDWDSLRAGRLAKISRALSEAGIDAALIQRYGNIRYVTSARMFPSFIYYPRYAAIVTAKGDVCFLSEAGDVKHSCEKMPWLEDVRTWSYDTATCIAAVCGYLSERELESATLGLDDAVSYRLAEGIRERLPGLTVAYAGDVFARAKAVKLSEELKVISTAAELAEIGMAAALETVAVGVKECVVAGEMMRAMLAAGSDAIIAHPQVSTDPLRRLASDKRIRHGDLVLVDVNVGFCGYAGDFARTTVVGTPTEQQVQLARAQLRCLDAAKSAVRPGAETAEVQAAVAHVVAEEGVEDAWHGYITGHGIGVDDTPYEWPLISSDADFDYTMEAGMVVALEPGLFRAGVGAVRNEDMVVVTEDGHKVLTHMALDERLL
jgi:Xaa-Pro aminopeptidase